MRDGTTHPEPTPLAINRRQRPSKGELRHELQRAEDVARTAGANLAVPTRVRFALLRSANQMWQVLERIKMIDGGRA